MTITEYAERILFSESLEEKLGILPLSELEDEGGGTSLLGKEQRVEPGRPLDLMMREKGEAGRTPLPARPQLVNEESRGVLFHFFANHELMAAELMALALLKFPEAPRAFRAGLLQTMREEQRHTRWYVQRMRDCGVEFGSHPLSRFFWDTVAPMETPLDYVTRLSLTFEQANLDYARHFSGVMKQAGDATSARLMERIYRDEISHVGYGLKWFRRWKGESQSDWEAFRESLVFPLSPSRAKGNGARFNREGRLEAGLGDDFVSELAVFERSKGRTPDVFWFNADAEAVMARGVDGGDYEPKRSVTAFLEDLESLVIFLARKDDIVLCRKVPRRAHLERLLEAGFELPEFEAVAIEGRARLPRLAENSLTSRRRLRGLRPWAWDPWADQLLEPLREGITSKRDQTRWSEALRSRFSKLEQAKRWPQWNQAEEAGEESIPVIAPSEVHAAAGRIREAWGMPVPIAWKPAFAAAGRGFWLVEEAGTNPVGFDGGPRRMAAIGEGVIEPWVERVFDFSVQFQRDAGGLRRLGFVRQEIGQGGRYLGTVWTPKFCRGLDTELARFLVHQALPAYDEGSPFFGELESWLGAADYEGPVGVDAFAYRDRNGRLRHRVVCEINPRYTMGRLALELSRRVSAGHSLKFTIERAAGSDGDTEAVTLERDGHGKLKSGRFPLTDAEIADGWVGWMEVAREVEAFGFGA